MIYKLLLAVLAVAATAPSIVLAQDDTIYETAANSDIFSTLATALEITGLDDVLDCERFFCQFFTAFAPTNAAFDGLGDLLTTLTTDEEWEEHLRRILLYHVTIGIIDSEDIEDGGSVPMLLLGEKVNTTLSGGSVLINDATVVAADVEASNGIIHGIDQVLIPEFMTKNIIETAQDAGTFDTLLTAVGAAGLTSTLEGDGPFTLFAPTDDAFEKLGDAVVADLLNDIPALTDILTYHLLSGTIELSSELEDGDTLTTVEGSTIDVESQGIWFFRVPVLNGEVHIVGADILTSNGVIHIINDVLLPPGVAPPTPTIAEIVAADSELTSLAAALAATDLDDFFGGDGPYTLFAPTDEAFEELGTATIESLLGDPEALASILTYHVAAGEVRKRDLEEGAVATLNGADAIIDRQFYWFSTRYYVNDARIVETDTIGSNGIIHKINKVLIPPSGSCLDVAAANGLTSLVSAIDAVDGLRNVIESAESLTIFAPTNEAFAAVGTLEELAANPSLDSILQYHVVPEVLTEADLSDADELATVEGSIIDVEYRYFLFFFFVGVFLNDDAEIQTTDIVCGNGGIIHIIDGVLLPPNL